MRFLCGHNFQTVTYLKEVLFTYFLNFVLQYGPMKSHQYFGYEGILHDADSPTKKIHVVLSYMSEDWSAIVLHFLI